MVCVADWFTEMRALDICEGLMFPLSDKSTIAPLSVVACIVVDMSVV